MKIDLISDLHGHYPKLEGGDLLIIGGDLTKRDEEEEYFRFFQWASEQFYKKIVIIGGNHDNFLQKNGDPLVNPGIFSYLCDSGIEFQGLKIWGSPWTKTFKGMNPKCKAFTFDEEGDLEKKFKMIPDDINILITHSPPYGIMDECVKGDKILSVGSTSLRGRLEEIKPKIHIFGHIHEGYGKTVLKRAVHATENNSLCINASHVDEWYRPINKPVRIEL